MKPETFGAALWRTGCAHNSLCPLCWTAGEIRRVVYPLSKGLPKSSQTQSIPELGQKSQTWVTEIYDKC